MAYENIQLLRDGHVATLKLNRPDTRNAMSIAMGDEVQRAVEEIRADDQIRVLVVTGEGKSFSAGGDLGMLAADAGVEAPKGAAAHGMGGRRASSTSATCRSRRCRFRPSRRSTATPSAPACASPSPAICASPPPTPSSA
jgi:enoyl-CoA hydratase/carnithine racemase